MVDLKLHAYVEWLHVIENMDLWSAKEKAQKVYFQRTGEHIELHQIFSTTEIMELRRAHMASIRTKKVIKKRSKAVA